ncbi:MAG: hypothetical protein IJ506_05225 [Clostridia bacterium]|nr:hypothetical protein [Clostridia bacterium]
MSSIKKNRILLTLSTLLFTLLLSLTVTVGVRSKKTVGASADGTPLSQTTYEMVEGAAIYLDETRLGIRFSAGMTEQAYTTLMNNVGAGKTYESIKFGVIIAPADYEDTYGVFNQANLFDATAVYDWATWDATTKDWVYTENGKQRVINIESTTLTLEDGKAIHYGAITTLQPHNLLTEFKGVGYIEATSATGVAEYLFATYGDDDTRTPVYVAQDRQQQIKTEIAALDPTEDALEIEDLNEESAKLDEYITSDVKAQTANYTVEYYYEKPDGDYFLYDTETKTANINTELSVNDHGVDSGITGVTFEEENVNNTADPVVFAQNKSVVKVYYSVAYGEDYDGTEKIYDLTATEDYALGDTRVTKLYDGDMQELTTSEGKVAQAPIVAMGKGEHTLYALTENGFEAYSAIMATHVITTGEELVAFLNSYSGSEGADTNSSDDWYAVLANDVNLSSLTLNEKTAQSDRFLGEFNGMGNAIYGANVTGAGGLFGGLHNATIKNFALVGVVSGSTVNASAIAGDFYPGAKMSNIYANVVISAGTSTYNGVIYGGQNGSLNNVIASVIYENTASDKYVYGQKTLNADFANYFAIGNATRYASGSTLTNVYADFNSFYTANQANITSENGFNKYWSVEQDGLYFGDMLIQNNEYASIKEYKDSAWSDKSAVTIDVASIIGETPTLVTIDGEELAVSDGKVTIDTTKYVLATNHPLFIKGETKNATLPVTVVTHAIKTSAEFKAYVGDIGGKTDVYGVLLNNISDAITISKGETTRFYGVFDGLGHTISNVTVSGAGGVFGAPQSNSGATYIKKAEIKNVAFVNLTGGALSNSNGGGLLIGFKYGGDISNIYVQGTQTSGTAFALTSNRGNGLSTINGVIDVQFSNKVEGTTYYAVNTGSSPTNTHLIGNMDGYSSSTTLTVNATYADAKSAIIADIQNGILNKWSSYWNIRDGVLYFGDTQIG